MLFNGPRVLLNFGSTPELTRNNIFHWANGLVLNKQVDSAIFNRSAATLSARTDDAGSPAPPLVSCDIASVDRGQTAHLSVAIRALIDELMNGVVFLRGTRYAISPLDRALLDDVGVPRPILRDGFE